MKKIIILAVALVATAISTTSFAQGTKMVGGAEMYPTKDIVDNAVNSKDHTTLVAAFTAAGLVETLKSDGHFTVLASTNEAFNKLTEWTAVITNDSGDKLSAILKGSSVVLKDENGATATITVEDINQKNGGCSMCLRN